MFRNIGVPRKSLNRMSLGNVTSYKKRGRNNFISPDKIVNNQNKDQNPFQRANLSAQPQTQVTGSLFGYNSSNNIKSERQNNFSNLTWSKNPEIISKSNESSKITKKNDILVQGNSINNNLYQNNNNMTNINLNSISGNIIRKSEEIKSSISSNFNNTGSFGNVLGNNKKTIEETVTTTNINNFGNANNVTGISNRNIEESKLTSINNGGVNVKSVLTNNNNLNLNTNTNNVNYFNNNNSQKETTTVYQTSESVYPIQNTKNSTQQEFNINQVSSTNNLNDIHDHRLGQMNQNITKTETIVTSTKTTNNLNDQNKLLNSNNITNNNRNDSHYSQGYEIIQYSTNNQQNIKQSGTQPVSSSNLFKGDLISVLNNEINKNQQELQEKSIIPQVNETHFEQTLYGLNGEVVHQVTKTQKVEYGNGMFPSFLFMYPVFGENKIIGALEDESTGKMNVDFKQTFGVKDIPLNEFPEGGAFCNRGKYLYFTGGQEKLKGIGKLFLRAFLQQNDYKIILVKMPPMIYSHWNHSMIANDNYIFVIGGYNSNKCEYFNLETLKWDSLPDLNSEERQRPMLVIYKDYLYAFMGHTQFNILDTIERINITKLNTSKWEKVSFSNPSNINSKFYEAGIYNHNGELFFIGGKMGLGNNESDFKKDIYVFNFDGMILNPLEMCYGGQLSFIETEFHKCNEENIGNFIDLNGGSLATIAIENLFIK
jgi:galactitol-specific phosphotransferase system IIB component